MGLLARCRAATLPPRRDASSDESSESHERGIIHGCTGVMVKVTEFASAEGKPTAEISGHAVVLAVGCRHARAARRPLAVRQRARLPGEDPLRHLQSAEPHRLPIAARPLVRALLRPLDDLVLIAVVPAVEDKLVRAARRGPR